MSDWLQAEPSPHFAAYTRLLRRPFLTLFSSLHFFRTWLGPTNDGNLTLRTPRTVYLTGYNPMSGQKSTGGSSQQHCGVEQTHIIVRYVLHLRPQAHQSSEMEVTEREVRDYDQARLSDSYCKADAEVGESDSLDTKSPTKINTRRNTV